MGFRVGWRWPGGNWSELRLRDCDGIGEVGWTEHFNMLNRPTIMIDGPAGP